MLMVANLYFLNMNENHDKSEAFGQYSLAKYLNFSKENGFLFCFLWSSLLLLLLF